MGVSYAYPSPLEDWYIHCPEDAYEDARDCEPGVFPDLLRECIDSGNSHLVSSASPTKEYKYVLRAPSLECDIVIQKWIKANSVCLLNGIYGDNSSIERRVQLVVTDRGKTIYLIE